MASAITHFIVGASLALPALESKTIRAAPPKWAIPVSGGLVAVAPDFDTFAMQALELPYSSFFGHRGFFHSPFFLILASALLAASVARTHPRRVVACIAVIWGISATTQDRKSTRLNSSH